MVIREIHGSELPALLELYKDLHTSDVPLPSPDVVAGVWDTIQKNPDLKYFGVFVDGALVSSCTLSVIPNLTRGCRPYGLIENVVTHPEFRRQGLGRSVLQHALAAAWSRGCYKVMLLTGRKDEATFSFYESSGFDRHAKQAFLANPARSGESE
jgi:GNAT superfamily N-acetyltransferase